MQFPGILSHVNHLCRSKLNRCKPATTVIVIVNNAGVHGWKSIARVSVNGAPRRKRVPPTLSGVARGNRAASRTMAAFLTPVSVTDRTELHAPLPAADTPGEVERPLRCHTGPRSRRIPHLHLPRDRVHRSHGVPEPAHYQTEDRLQPLRQGFQRQLKTHGLWPVCIFIYINVYLSLMFRNHINYKALF